jgi:hypothetical protein
MSLVSVRRLKSAEVQVENGSAGREIEMFLAKEQRILKESGTVPAYLLPGLDGEGWPRGP